jgi:hypothetical protein
VKASFTVADLERNLTLFFEGKRQELNYSDWTHNKTVPYPAIGLAPPDNHTGLHFTFANGTDIQWHQDGSSWVATSSGVLTLDHRVSLLWMSAVVAIVFVLS